MKLFIKAICISFTLLSLNSCYSYQEKNELAVPPIFEQEHKTLTKNKK